MTLEHSHAHGLTVQSLLIRWFRYHAPDWFRKVYNFTSCKYSTVDEHHNSISVGYLYCDMGIDSPILDYARSSAELVILCTTVKTVLV